LVRMCSRILIDTIAIIGAPPPLRIVEPH